MMLAITESSAIQPAKTGLKLTSNPTSAAKLAARDLLALPFNVYFLDRNSRLLLGNQPLARNHLIDDICQFKGCTVEALLPKKSEARKIIAHDRQILDNSLQQFFEETYFLADEQLSSYLSFKMPLIDERDQVVGLLGCSALIDQGTPQMLPFLNALITTNLLQANTSHLMTASHPQLTPRERQICSLTQQGYTAKHIGRVLQLSNRTIERHLLNIKLKLDVTSKNQLIDKLKANEVI